MRTVLFSSLLAAATLVMGPQVAAQRSYLVAVPDQVKPDAKQKVLAAAVELGLKASPGDRIQWFDGWAMTRIADLRVTASKPKSRARELAPELRKLKAFFDRPVETTRECGLRWPQFFALAASTVTQAASDKTTLILLGNPYYSDSRDPSAVYGPNQVPSDGFLTAQSPDSIWGCADRRGLLAGATAHFALLRPCASTRQQTKLGRFASIFSAQLGATLVSYQPGIKIVMERALSGFSKPLMTAAIDPEDSDLVIHELRDRRAVTTGRGASPQTPVPQEPVSQKPVPQKPVVQEPASRQKGVARKPVATARPTVARPVNRSAPRRPLRRPTPVNASVPKAATERLVAALEKLPAPKEGHFNLAAVWTTTGQAGLSDVDVWVQPGKQAPIVFYRNVLSPDARLMRDVRIARTSLADDSWLSNWEVCEVSRSKLEETRVWLNLHRAGGGVTSGIVRITCDDVVIDEPFEFTHATGDRARGRVTRRGPCWRRIDVANLVARAKARAAR